MKIKIRGLLYLLLTLLLIGGFRDEISFANNLSMLTFFDSENLVIDVLPMEKNKEVNLLSLKVSPPKKEGETFLYWTINGVKTDKLLTVENEYSILAFYCKNGDVVKVVPQEPSLKEFLVKRGDIIEMQNLSKEGYNFVGWYLDKNFSDVFSGEVNTQESELYLYPKFTKIKVQLKINDVKLEYGNHKFFAEGKVLEFNYGDKVNLDDIKTDLNKHNFIGFLENGEHLNDDFFIKFNREITPIFERIKFKVEFLGINQSLLFYEDVFIYDTPSYKYVSENNKYYLFNGWNEKIEEIVKDTEFIAKYIRFYDKEYYNGDILIKTIFEKEDVNPEFVKEGCMPAKFLVIDKTVTLIKYEILFDKIAYKVLNEPHPIYDIAVAKNLYFEDTVDVSIIFKNKNYQLDNFAIADADINLIRTNSNSFKFIMPSRNIRFTVAISEIPKNFALFNNLDNLSLIILEDIDYSGLGVGNNYLILSENSLEIDSALLPKGEAQTWVISAVLTNSLENEVQLYNYNLYLLKEEKQTLYYITESGAVELNVIEKDGKQYYKIPIKLGNIQLALIKEDTKNYIGLIILLIIGVGYIAFLAIKNRYKIKKYFKFKKLKKQ